MRDLDQGELRQSLSCRNWKIHTGKDIGSNSSSQMCQLSSQRTTLPEFPFLCGFQVRVDHKGSVLEVWKVEVKWQPTLFKG